MRTRKKPKTHPCAFCEKPFVRKAHRVGAVGMSGIISKGGWPPVPRSQKYCSDDCRKRAAVAKKRSGEHGAPANIAKRKRTIIRGRVVYVPGVANERQAIETECAECGKSFEWSGKGRPPKYCSGACRTKFCRKNRTDKSAAEWKKSREGNPI